MARRGSEATGRLVKKFADVIGVADVAEQRDPGHHALRPREELYHLPNDQLETHNLIHETQHSDVATVLSARLDEFLATTEDPILEGPSPEGAIIDAFTEPLR